MKSIADLSNDDGSWNTDLVHDVFGVPLGDKICKIDRLPVDHNDILVWKEAGDGIFTVKRGFQSIHPTQDNSDSSFWKLIWNQSTHFRHSTNIWRLVSGCFPTRDRMVFVADKACPMCDVENETALHIFWECHCARAIWFSSPFACFGRNTMTMTTVKDMLQGMLTCLPNDLKGNFLNFLGSLIEGVWRARNELIFKGKRINIEAVRCAILRKYNDCLLAGEADSTIGMSIKQARAGGKITSATEVVVVCDASWKEGEAGLAVGMMETRGKKICWFAKKTKAESAAEAEIKAIRWAMDIAAKEGYAAVAIASDAMIHYELYHILSWLDHPLRVLIFVRPPRQNNF
ncbi:hypothetical protein G4B88_026581 [Cannabis sativa]|uniref:Reverse transcriptase zinc-binding domain-containing protein n=1 Tax=Cannabis sativa TaxID=3483 RepID=A0A7J6GRB0_CANSA|nr:hypothetical protein G4B88_026581 [Cannabis sativa]